MNNTFNGALLRDKKTKKYFIQGTVYDIYHILRGKILTDNIQKIYDKEFLSYPIKDKNHTHTKRLTGHTVFF